MLWWLVSWVKGSLYRAVLITVETTMKSAWFAAHLPIDFYLKETTLHLLLTHLSVSTATIANGSCEERGHRQGGHWQLESISPLSWSTHPRPRHWGVPQCTSDPVTESCMVCSIISTILANERQWKHSVHMVELTGRLLQVYSWVLM